MARNIFCSQLFQNVEFFPVFFSEFLICEKSSFSGFWLLVKLAVVVSYQLLIKNNFENLFHVYLLTLICSCLITLKHAFCPKPPELFKAKESFFFMSNWAYIYMKGFFIIVHLSRIVLLLQVYGCLCARRTITRLNRGQLVTKSYKTVF